MLHERRCRRLPVSPACHALAALMTGALLCSSAGRVHGSDLLVSSVGAADTGMAAADLASPRSPAGAQFANPAGLARFATTINGGLGAAYGTGRFEATFPAGYEENNSVIAMIPEFAYVKRGEGPW